MIPAITASKIYSVLGNNNSLVPLAIKDIANSVGLTAGSYIIGQKEEGQDRFIDEFGTQAIWLLGIPAYKKVIDLALFKTMGYDPKIDVRLLKNKDIFEKAKEFAQNDQVKAAFEKVGKNQKTFKGLTIAKFAASTLLTIGTYGALTHYRHKYTEENLRKKILAEHEAKVFQQQKNNNTAFTPIAAKPPAFKGVSVNENKDREQVAFKGALENFMFSPVKNLMLVDGAITGERLATSRSMQDFLGYTIKEGSFWFFMYFAGQKIQEHLEKSAVSKHKKSIDLDARVIESDELKKAFEDKSLAKNLEAFNKCKTDVEIYEFVNRNPDNFVVKMAKKSDIIKVEDGKIDTRAYIDIDEVKGVAKKLETLQTQYKESGESLETFLNGVKKLKRSSVWKNMGACIMALGVLAPALMIGLRYLRQDKEFQVKEQVEKELIAEGKIH